MLITESFEDIVDVEVRGNVYLLTRTKLIILRIFNERLILDNSFTLDEEGPRALHIRERIYIVYATSIVAGDLDWNNHRSFPMRASNCLPSSDGKLLFFTGTFDGRGTLIMYSNSGERLAECDLESPTYITQMS